MIRFVGTYRQNDGWGNGAKNYLKALSLDNDVCANTLLLSTKIGEVDQWIKDLEAKTGEVDTEVHHVLPGTVQLSKDKKNIWIGYTETRNLKNTGWLDALAQYDQCWCPTVQEKEKLELEGLTNVHHIPMPLDLERLNSTPLNEKQSDAYIFYFIGEWCIRKNIGDLIMAYFREFKKEENTKLLLKLSGGTKMREEFSKYLYNIKGTMRLYPSEEDYPTVYLISDFLDYETMIDIHHQCDCFIMPSYGESTCIPLVEALYFGKDVICTQGIGCDDKHYKMRRVKSVEDICVCSYPPLKNIYTGWETWRKINILDLQVHMRSAFYSKSVPNDVYIYNTETIQELHSYESVANRISDVL